MENKVICSSLSCCSFKEWQLKTELIHTAEGRFCTMQLSHTNGVFHCFGRRVFVSCNGAEQACGFPHNSLDKMCTFFSPCLRAIGFTTQALSLRTFPKANLQAVFHTPIPKEHF